MTVKIFANKVMVDPPQVKVPEGETGELIWTASPETVTIEYIGFASPVGPGNQIQDLRPEAGPVSTWKATDNNSAKGLLTYFVFAKAGGQVFSSDPQIVNEGPPGGDEEMKPWESKP